MHIVVVDIGSRDFILFYLSISIQLAEKGGSLIKIYRTMQCAVLLLKLSLLLCLHS